MNIEIIGPHAEEVQKVLASRGFESTVAAGHTPPQWGAFDSTGKLRAILDSESEAYHYVRNRGHMHGGSHRKIVPVASELLAALETAVEIAGSWPEDEYPQWMKDARAAIAKAKGAA